MAAPNIYQTIMNAESGGQNVKNYMYDSQHTASGYFQITNSTWATTTAGQNSGVVNAMDAPYATQQAAAKELIQRNGLSDWAPYDHIDANVSHYDTSLLSGPGGTPTGTTPAAYDQPTTGHSDASTSTYSQNPDGSYTQTSANGVTKAIAATTPVAIATGSDEISGQSAANTKSAIAAANSIYGLTFGTLGDGAMRVALVVLGLVLLAGALYLIASEQGQALVKRAIAA